jgi:hypothetical protein
MPAGAKRPISIYWNVLVDSSEAEKESRSSPKADSIGSR